MDKVLYNSLRFNEILDLIQPVGEAGKHHKHHLSLFKPGQEASLRKEFNRLESLVSILKQDKKLVLQLNSALSQAPYLPQTLKALNQRPLFLHECFEIKKLVHYALQLKQNCERTSLIKHYPFPELQKLYDLLDPEKTQSPGFALSSSFDPMLARILSELQELQLSKRHAEQSLLQEARKKAGLTKPIQEIVVSRMDSKKVQKLQNSGYYRLSDENFANLTFHLNDSKELAGIKKEIATLIRKLTKVEEKVLINLSSKIKNHYKALARTAELVQMLDWDYAKAVFARTYICVIPKISARQKIKVSMAVNLPLKINLTENKRKYQPLDLQFDNTLNVLTGPNMGGKTTALHTIGQLLLLAGYALPVPAENAELCLFDNIWFNKEMEGGENLSSFGKEIVSLAAVLKKKGRTLYLFDELAKGTNPREGEAILTAVLQYLSDKTCLVLAATHYDRPARLKHVTQFSIKGIDRKSLTKLTKAERTTLDAQLDLLNQLMDYSLVKVTDKLAPPQNAIPIAKTLGLTDEIIKKAEVLTNKKG